MKLNIIIYDLVYDLSTSGKCNSNFVIPSIRIGHLRIRVQFSIPLPLDLQMLVFCEFPSTIFIHKDGQISTRYIF